MIKTVKNVLNSLGFVFRFSFLFASRSSLSPHKNCAKLENGASDDAIASKGGVAEKDSSNEQTRSNFQQMISAAVSNAQQQNMEYAFNNNRRRIGSGRIVDSTRENLFPIGMDARYMRNKLFKEDGKSLKSSKSGIDLHWNDSANHPADIDNIDAKSDEPEWANCGPIS